MPQRLANHEITYATIYTAGIVPYLSSMGTKTVIVIWSELLWG
jgi:hypothetical protein